MYLLLLYFLIILFKLLIKPTISFSNFFSLASSLTLKKVLLASHKSIKKTKRDEDFIVSLITKHIHYNNVFF